MQLNSKKNTKFSILVIDDDETSFMIKAIVEKRADTEVFIAHSGSEILDLVSKHEFSLVVIDLELFIMNDFGFTEYFKGSDKTKNIPIIFVTANSREHSIALTGEESGVVDFLHKPLDHFVVKSKINMFLEYQRHKTDIKSLEQKFSHFIESSVDAIVLVNDLGAVELINKQAELMFGYERNEIIGKHMSLLVPESHCELFLSSTDSILLGQGRSLFGCHKNGTEFSIEISLDLLNVDSNLLVSATIRNTSERYAWEIEREKLLEKFKQNQIELERSIMLREEFMSIAGHELKTPITALKLRLQLRLKRLLDLSKKTDAFSADKLEVMFDSDIQQVNRLTELIEKILDITRVNSGKLNLKMENFNIGELVEEVVERHAEQLKMAGGLISVNIQDSINGYWDKVRIDQVITNLLSNAIKYGAGKSIAITVSRKLDLVFVAVKDNGLGIKHDDLKRIFKRFERASNSDISGFGLGLYIVTQIIEAHKGSVRVESMIGNGSQFTLSLPIVTTKSLSPFEVYIQENIQ